jgi:hypothetical protein
VGRILQTIMASLTQRRMCITWMESSTQHRMCNTWRLFFSRNSSQSERSTRIYMMIFTSCWTNHRQSISTAMGLALDDDDMYHYQIYKDLFDQANCKMHTVLSKGMQMVNMRSSSDVNRGRGNHQDAVQNPITSAFSPPALHSVNVHRWRGVDSLRLGDSTPRGHLKQSYKETDHAFEILLSYQGVVSARMVNENLPNRILHSMAKGYLEDEFGFRLNSENGLELEFGGRLLPRLGVLGDVPIYPGSTIIIRYYPIKPPISGESPLMPSAKIGPSFPGDGIVGTGRFGAVGFSPSGERPSM